MNKKSLKITAQHHNSIDVEVSIMTLLSGLSAFHNLNIFGFAPRYLKRRKSGLKKQLRQISVATKPNINNLPESATSVALEFQDSLIW